MDANEREYKNLVGALSPQANAYVVGQSRLQLRTRLPGDDAGQKRTYDPSIDATSEAPTRLPH